jgi:hypothetical protein
MEADYRRRLSARCTPREQNLLAVRARALALEDDC